MFSFDIVILVAFLALVVGAIGGVFFGRTLLPPKQQKHLEDELEQTREELRSYQQDVADHFVQSSSMLKKLSSQYKVMHEHLAKGAIALTNSETSQKVLNASAEESADEVLEQLTLDHPKDWAPKRPGESGALSEDYGLEKPSNSNKPIEVSSARGHIPKHPS